MHLIEDCAPGEESLVPLPYSADCFAIAPHGVANTHIDALCHVFHNEMYNGYPSSDVAAQGALNGAIHSIKNGIVSRGVLIDIPPLKNRDCLEPGEAVTSADLEAAEQTGRFKVEEGDVLFVRTGRHVRQKTQGTRDVLQDGLAGLGAACLPWIHERKVAVLDCDGVSDVVPSGYDNLIMSIHSCTLVAMGIPRHSSRLVKNTAVYPGSHGYTSARQLPVGRSERGLRCPRTLDVHADGGAIGAGQGDGLTDQPPLPYCRPAIVG